MSKYNQDNKTTEKKIDKKKEEKKQEADKKSDDLMQKKKEVKKEKTGFVGVSQQRTPMHKSTNPSTGEFDEAKEKNGLKNKLKEIKVEKPVERQKKIKILKNKNLEENQKKEESKSVKLNFNEEQQEEQESDDLPEEIKKKLEKKKSERKAKPLKKKKKKTEKKYVTIGKAYIQATYNNTIVTFTDLLGNVISSASSGMAGFKGAKKSTSYAAQIVTKIAAMKAKQEYNLKEVSVFIKGVGNGRESATRSLNSNGLIVTSIKDVTPMPHNGCRRRKPRRV